MSKRHSNRLTKSTSQNFNNSDTEEEREFTDVLNSTELHQSTSDPTLFHTVNDSSQETAGDSDTTLGESIESTEPSPKRKVTFQNNLSHINLITNQDISVITEQLPEGHDQIFEIMGDNAEGNGGDLNPQQQQVVDQAPAQVSNAQLLQMMAALQLLTQTPAMLNTLGGAVTAMEQRLTGLADENRRMTEDMARLRVREDQNEDQMDEDNGNGLVYMWRHVTAKYKSAKNCKPRDIHEIDFMLALERELAWNDLEANAPASYKKQVKLYYRVVKFGWTKTLEQMKREEETACGMDPTPPQPAAPPKPRYQNFQPNNYGRGNGFYQNYGANNFQDEGRQPYRNNRSRSRSQRGGPRGRGRGQSNQY